MPYYLHTIADSPETGKAYDTKPEALADRQDGQTVTFIASDAEKTSWRERELDRQIAGTYVRVPWDGELCGTSETLWHFAHVSLDVPGMIAYTPDDAYGIADRQIRTKPGKYLQQFYPQLTPAEINAYASRVKAYTNTLQLATTPDDIAKVYCAEDGPTSCMSRDSCSKRLKFPFEDHPTRVYGDSDLAIAYIGELRGELDSSIAARAIVWPAKSVYGRLYGDEATLKHVLESAGYVRGSMRGARVRAIDDGNGDYLMPYVDGIDYADLDGDYFVLGRGEYGVQETNGTTSEGSHNTCSNCGDRCDGDESYCYSCEQDRHYCDGCGEDFFDSDAGTYSGARGEWRCDDCWESHDCEACNETLHEYNYRRSEWPATLCSDCEDMTPCEGCSEYSDNVDSDGYCEDCRKCSECNQVCDQRSDRDDDDRCEDCHAEAQCNARLTPARPAGRILRLHRVGVQAPTSEQITILRNDGSILATVEATPLTPFLYLHRTIDRDDRWTLTHKPTSLAVTCYLAFEDAGYRLAKELTHLDWDFVTGYAIPQATANAARAIVANYRTI